MSNINIQIQDAAGNWQTYCVTQNNSQMITASMKSLSARFPNYRVRAVDSNGRIVDIL
jgi:hypothetical protein